MRRTHACALVAALVGMTFLPALAHAAAGQVVFTLGPVEIERAGQTLVAGRGSALEVGDTVSTGPTAFTQLRFKDGALLALRGGSRMTVEDFKLPDGAPVSTATTPPPGARVMPVAAAASGGSGYFSNGGGRTILRLARGAFRSITGLIGKASGDEYKVITPAATIGIRGTDYSASYCETGCGADPTGLFVGVSYGAITVSNETGTLNLDDNQYAYIKDNATPPNQQIAPPASLETPIQPETKGEGGETGAGPDSGGASGTTGGETAPPPPDSGGTSGGQTGSNQTGSTSQSEATKPAGTYEILPGLPGSFSVASGSVQAANDNGVYVDSTSAMIGFLTSSFTSSGNSQVVNRGYDPATGLTWGRWSGGTTGGSNTIDTSLQPLHWIYAFSPSPVVMPVTGSATYTLLGNTDPTDNNGGTPGFLGSATFSANFTTQQVTSTLNIGINNQVWLANSSGAINGSISGSLFSGTYNVQINDATGTPVDTSATGSFNGFFTNNAAGAGLTFSLTNSANTTTVSGAAAFGNPH